LSSTCQITAAQATIEFLTTQYVEPDGVERLLFACGCGIVGQVNLVGVGQALQQDQEFPCYLSRNEHAMVHTAVAVSNMTDRLRTFAGTTAIGPGPTNMPSGAATTSINRILGPLPSGDIFVRHYLGELRQALIAAATNLRTTATVIEGDRNAGVPGYES
jgi:3D-(3,5/4)-trihydroxycyclohexane-1,2-dione acylhydrolase (decyclizing)